jgi:hypothetical protein
LAEILAFTEQEPCQNIKDGDFNALQATSIPKFGKLATLRRTELGIFTSCCKCDIAAQH